jgi:hypothetical protein
MTGSSPECTSPIHNTRQRSSSVLRQLHFFESEAVYFPVVFIEMGSFETRLGVWNDKTTSFEERFVRCSFESISQDEKYKLLIRYSLFVNAIGFRVLLLS